MDLMVSLELRPAAGSALNRLVDATAQEFAVEAGREGGSYDEALGAAYKQCRDELARGYARPMSGPFLVEAGASTIVGELWLADRDRPAPNCRHILWLQIFPEFRRRGFAGALLEKIISEGRALGIAALTLNVFRSNQIAGTLYSKHGFERDEHGLIRWLRKAGG